MGRKRGRPGSVAFWDALPWAPVSAELSLMASDDSNGLTGMLQLEEISGDQFRVLTSSAEQPPQLTTASATDTVSVVDPDLLCVIADAEAADDFDDSRMASWRPFELDRRLVRGLATLGFHDPTEIQARLANPLLRFRKDVIAAAETGSGKTLAFGLPLLSRVLTTSAPRPRKLLGLVLSPTRELALQIVRHLHDVAQFTDIQIASCVGGLAATKQKRLLLRRPEIVVATPGRFWDLVGDAGADPDLSAALDLGALQFLVVDEADRMVAQGCYRELDRILAVLERQRASYQTVLLSATMTSISTKARPKSARSGSAAKSTLDDLIGRIQFRGKPEIVDVTTNTRVASNITEGRIQCLPDDKDFYVYYFLHKYPGRNIVFANSIACVRRFHGLFSLLNLPIYQLHSSMQQRQRLKNLDRFRTMANCVLICTDVAARGIDVLDVDNVIHYHLSPSSDVYVHRAGRTGRASATGFSLILVSPNEMTAYGRQVQELNRKIAEFPVETNMLEPIKKRVKLASRLDRLLSSTRKSSSEKNWFEKNAAEMDIILDDDLAPKTANNQQSKKEESEIESLRAALQAELETPLIPKGVSRSFITVNTATHE